MRPPIQITDILLNAQEIHSNHPDTFYAPSQDELATIKRGDNVKIGAVLDYEVCDASAERFWVLVNDVTDTSIIGVVNNDLLFTQSHNLKDGDHVQFDFCAVMDIISAEPK
jgi:molybdopterin converting factor small subunit